MPGAATGAADRVRSQFVHLHRPGESRRAAACCLGARGLARRGCGAGHDGNEDWLRARVAVWVGWCVARGE